MGVYEWGKVERLLNYEAKDCRCSILAVDDNSRPSAETKRTTPRCNQAHHFALPPNALARSHPTRHGAPHDGAENVSQDSELNDSNDDDT